MIVPSKPRRRPAQDRIVVVPIIRQHRSRLVVWSVRPAARSMNGLARRNRSE